MDFLIAKVLIDSIRDNPLGYEPRKPRRRPRRPARQRMRQTTARTLRRWADRVEPRPSPAVECG